jgi:hypothetical protein
MKASDVEKYCHISSCEQPKAKKQKKINIRVFIVSGKFNRYECKISNADIKPIKAEKVIIVIGFKPIPKIGISSETNLWPGISSNGYFMYTHNNVHIIISTETIEITISINSLFDKCNVI